MNLTIDSCETNLQQIKCVLKLNFSPLFILFKHFMQEF